MLSDDCIKSAIQILQPRGVLYNSDIRAAISKLECALKMREEENTNTALLATYDQYFDSCERANKTPLSFDNWCSANI